MQRKNQIYAERSCPERDGDRENEKKEEEEGHNGGTHARLDARRCLFFIVRKKIDGHAAAVDSAQLTTDPRAKIK